MFPYCLKKVSHHVSFLCQKCPRLGTRAAPAAGRSGGRLCLASALQSLPPQYLEVILLRDFEELSIAEIAVQLQLTAAAVKSRLHRARALRREYLLA